MTFDPAAAVALVMLAALALYAILGGADFGAGVWDLLAVGPGADRQRRLIAQAIGPVWEVNHIWIILVIVVLFTAFPPAFAVIMTYMHMPLSLMLVGIVLRGSAFTFRAYDNTPLGKTRWNRAFSVPSTVVPIVLGCIVGSLLTGRIARDGTREFAPWYSVFPLAVGLFTLAIFAYVAAVFLTLETRDEFLRDAFRARALASAVALGLIAYAVYALAETHAPRIHARLQDRDWGFVVRVITGLCALGAIVMLWRRRYAAARAAAVLQVACVLLGCAAALAPLLVPPDLTISNSAAPRVVQWWLLGALALGGVVLAPSLVYLFRIFKREALAASEPASIAS